MWTKRVCVGGGGEGVGLIHTNEKFFKLSFKSMINRKEKIKWRGDLKETTRLIPGQVSSLKIKNRS